MGRVISNFLVESGVGSNILENLKYLQINMFVFYLFYKTLHILMHFFFMTSYLSTKDSGGDGVERDLKTLVVICY